MRRTQPTIGTALLLAIALLICLPASCAARPEPKPLPDFEDPAVGTIVSAGANPAATGPGKLGVFAQAHEAEVKNNPKSKGLHHNEATMYVVAGDNLPSARQMAATRSGGARAAGGVLGAAITAFGPVAVAITDTGHRAISGVNAFPSKSLGASGSTTAVWDPPPLRKGIGATKQVFTDSIAVNDDAPSAAGISNIGGGPIAVATAGEAVAVANADTQANEGVGIQR